MYKSFLSWAVTMASIVVAAQACGPGEIIGYFGCYSKKAPIELVA